MVSGKKDIIFFGTPGICIPYLESLKDAFNIKLIITQPDSTGGRKNRIFEPPAKKYAISERIPVIQPSNLGVDIENIISEINPAIGIIISYGKFLPERIFKIPEFNTVNIHFSLLPLYRGSAPIQRAIENGERYTGLTVFEIDKEMDTGPIWWQKKHRISSGINSEELIEEMSSLGAELLPEVILKIITGKLNKIPQDNNKATYAKIIKKDEGRINWKDCSSLIYNRLRAFYPWPGIFFFSDDKKIIVKDAFPVKTNLNHIPGLIININRIGMTISCGENSALEITLIQPAGKKPMTPYTFSLGNKFSKILN